MKVYGSIYRSSARKIVTIKSVGHATDTEIEDFAMAKANESRASLFGWDVKRFPDEDAAEVTLWTD